MAEDFIAAKPSRLVRGFFQLTLPVILPRLGVTHVEYEPADLDRLRALSPYTVLLTPNHPTNTEPALMFHLSRVVRQPFLYLACRETFEPLWGLWGAIIRRVGAFSVVRGTIDRASFRATRDLLARAGSKVVIFPEGEVYSQNDSLLPFHSGVFQIAFWALEDVRKAGHADQPLYVLPVAIKYRFTRDITPEIRASLDRLEKFTGASSPPGSDIYARLRAVGEAMLHSLEHEYRLTPPKGGDNRDLTPRLDAIKEAILARVAAAAGVALPRGETLPERMRALIYVIETVTRDEPQDKTPYDTELRRQQQARAQPLLKDLRRLANWIAVYDGYVAADPTQERIADMLTRLERECFGRERIGGPRVCRLRLGEPIDLQEHWTAYEASRRAEVARVTRAVEESIASLLAASPVPEGLFA